MSKGNKYAPEFESDLPAFINVTSLKKTVIKIPTAIDKDKDPVQIKPYFENVTSFVKLKGQREIVFNPTEEDEG